MVLLKRQKKIFLIHNSLFMLHFIGVAHAGVISDAPKVSGILVNILNFLLSVISVLAIIMIAISGIMYLLSSGDERRTYKAKRAFIYSVIGMAVSLSGLILVRTIGSFFQ